MLGPAQPYGPRISLPARGPIAQIRDSVNRAATAADIPGLEVWTTRTERVPVDRPDESVGERQLGHQQPLNGDGFGLGPDLTTTRGDQGHRFGG